MQAQALEGRWMRQFLLKPVPRTCSGDLNLLCTYLRLALGEYLAPYCGITIGLICTTSLTPTELVTTPYIASESYQGPSEMRH